MRLFFIYFVLFMTYSFLGWCLEVFGKLLEKKKFINRGFLIGPYCPIYGFGALIITFLLGKYTNDWPALFILSSVVCGILEYFTSFLMEKIFKARWWDYSTKKFNINGRICLDTLIIFGLLGLFIMYISNPFLLNVLNKLPNLSIEIIAGLLFLVYFTDNIISFNVISTVRNTAKGLYKELDNTEEITKKVKEILLSKSILYRRLIKAYPTLQTIKQKIKENTDKIKEEIEQRFK